MQKTIDKIIFLWYNKYVIKRENSIKQRGKTYGI